MAALKKGDNAPGFSLADQNGNSTSLEDYKGKKVLLYFYPRADTPGCTKQACSVRDNMATLKGLSIAVLGISPDSPERQKKFDDKYNLGFPLLSDTDHRVADLYGVWGEKSMYGKKLWGILRSSFLIDEKGTVIDRWYKVKPLDTVRKAVQALGD
ncbi:MAG: thioredoxin-dependent thiol peroxidase [Spirochaetota bacterium]|nr:MAG: thioredoxin-dependent thiol peroxidase [Spirochaetota bacterium]